MHTRTSFGRTDLSEQQALVGEIEALLLKVLAIRVESADADLLDSGFLDSVSLIRLNTQLEKHFSLQLPVADLDFESFRSIYAIAELVARKRGTGFHPAAGPARQAAPELVAGHNDILKSIQSLLADQLSIRVEDMNADLLQTGILDSIGLIQLIAGLESSFGLKFKLEALDVEAFRSVAAIANLISGSRRSVPENQAQ